MSLPSLPSAFVALTPATRFLLVSLLRVAAIAAIIGVIAGWIGGGLVGEAAAALVVFTAFGYYAWKLAQLSEWLQDPKAATLPDADGLWGEVLIQLYRMLRDERLNRESLAAALSNFQQAASALPDGAVMLDNAYNIVWLNPTAEAHWNISRKNDRMQTITYLIRYPEFIEYLNARQYGVPLTLSFSRAEAGGGAKELVFTVRLVPFGDEQMLLLSRDVSEREQLETVRRDFVANVSHELRTPITVMSGFLETITNASALGNNNPALLEKALAHMTVQADRMQRLVEDLLTLSRLEDQSHRLAEAPINVPELVQSLYRDAEQLSGGLHTITVTTDGVWLLGNRDEIISAFSNLVTNAVRYTPSGGNIDITWTLCDGQPSFCIADNGEGIAPEHLPRLTERFYRVDRGRSQATGGTGLGLAIVKHVLIRHGGRLDVQSSMATDGHGTQFTANFPKERVCAAAPALRAVAA
ncbi:MAG: phosphate regulon sensor histidine kinase PhoR [Betaproteobacteria bacterium]